MAPFHLTQRTLNATEFMSEPLLLSAIELRDGVYALTAQEAVVRILNGLIPTGPRAPDVDREVLAGVNHADVRIETNEVERALQAIKANKAPGSDRIPGKALKVASNARLLAGLLQDCVSTGYFPDAWKNGLLRYILKDPEKTQVC
ncbi:hypothetical protein M8J76_008193 [Diaphorina citri]|nr:hypothetical protein M8J75_004447 [Diaphorina citri]KAI5723572.1 hypothetical protein M8J76_008193 [Diaphorina citri]